MMMNEDAQKELDSYWRISVRVGLVIEVLLLLLLLFSWGTGLLWLIKPLIGAMVASLLASLNVIALAYAFWVLAIHKGSRWVLLWPIFLFLGMCVSALVVAVNQPDWLLGFALGLCTPLITGTMISLAKPA